MATALSKMKVPCTVVLDSAVAFALEALKWVIAPHGLADFGICYHNYQLHSCCLCHPIAVLPEPHLIHNIQTVCALLPKQLP